MVKFTAVMHKFDKKGEKSGWTYVEIPADIAQKIKPGHKKEYKVKGKLDNFPLKRVSMLPMGGGKFIMPINAAMRKGIGKRHGAMVKLQLEADDSAFVFNKDFIACLEDEPKAKAHFGSLPGSHQRYFSKWIDSAKTEPTRVKRIALAVSALAKKWGYPEMIRNQQKENQ